jgi:hypothetical protein
MNLTKLSSAVLVALAALTPSSQEATGEVVNFTFLMAPVNARGIESLADFAGRPVLIDYWSMTGESSALVVVPAVMRLVEKHGDAIGVIMSDSRAVKAGEQFAKFDEMERFVWNQGWMGNGVLWTLERPVQIPPESNLPYYVLLDIEGRVIARGNPTDDHERIDELIDEQLKAAARVPKDTPKELEKAWKEFLAGKWAKGIELARAASESTGAGAAPAEQLVLTFESRIEAKVARLERLLEGGGVAEATVWLADLENKARGVEVVAERLTKLRETLESEATKKEGEAEAALSNVLRKCYDDGIDEKAAKLLAKLAETHTGTKAGERASRLSQL